MKMRMLAVVAAIVLVPGVAIADHHKDKAHHERAGNCSDARKQREYFCDQSNAAQDSMVAIGTACNNAKNNVKAACEGIDTPDAEYKFDE
jgi:hypothetical protein